MKRIDQVPGARLWENTTLWQLFEPEKHPIQEKDVRIRLVRLADLEGFSEQERHLTEQPFINVLS